MNTLSFPVFTNEEAEGHCHTDTDFPRAVIHLINKRPNCKLQENQQSEAERIAAVEFSPDDTRKLRELSLMIGRCHDNISKIEQLHSMVDVTQGL